MTLPDIDRRRFLARSLVAGGALAVPTILTMEPASAAALQSPPPQRSGGSAEGGTHAGGPLPPPPAFTSNYGDHLVPTAIGDADTVPDLRPDPAVALPGGLPKTGANIERETIVGAGLFAAGTSMWLWSAGDV